MAPEHAQAAVRAGAEYIGIMFAPSRRRVTQAQAVAIAAAARQAAAETGRVVGVVGVFVDEQPDTINSLVAEAGLDMAQLSGHEWPATASAIAVPVIKAIRFDAHASEAAWLALDHDRPLLLDAHVAGSWGGAGVTGDWQRAVELAAERQVWLAGGLTPANVGAAVRLVRPRVVDVSSGVERDGIKDAAAIDAFVRAAKAAGEWEAGNQAAGPIEEDT